MPTKIIIEHQGRTIWEKEDSNILDPKDITIKFDSGIGNTLIWGTIQDIVTNNQECPVCGHIEDD